MFDQEDVFSQVDAITPKEIVDFIDQLVRVNTTVPPGDCYGEFIGVVSPRLEKLGFQLQVVVVPDELIKTAFPPLTGPRPNLVAMKDYGMDHTITFYGHMDVVPAPDEENERWRTNPFQAILKGKRIFGRGVADMKGSIATLIIVLELLQKLKLKPKYNLRIVLCTDEEIGGKPGVCYLAENGFVQGTIYCMDGIMWDKFVVGALGDALVEITTTGTSCHSGMNYLGINAIDAMVPILDELLILRKQVEARRSKIPGIARPETPTERVMSPMFNLSVIKGGIKSNIVPGTCQLVIDRRMIPEEKVEDVRQEILDAVNRGKARSIAKEVKFDFHDCFAPLITDPNTPSAKRLQRVIRIVSKIKAETLQQLALPASTDMGFLNEILKTKDILMRGIGNASSNAHGVNEVVSLSDIYTFMKEVLLFLCGDL